MHASRSVPVSLSVNHRFITYSLACLTSIFRLGYGLLFACSDGEVNLMGEGRNPEHICHYQQRSFPGLYLHGRSSFIKANSDQGKLLQGSNFSRENTYLISVVLVVHTTHKTMISKRRRQAGNKLNGFLSNFLATYLTYSQKASRSN